MNSRKRFVVGFSWSLASAFLWSTTYVSGRFLMAGGAVDPVTLSMIRFVVGGLLLMAVGAVLFPRRMWAITWGDALRLSLLGAFGVVGMSLFFFFGQQTVTAITSSLIMQTSPVMTYFGSVLVGERIGWRGAAGIFVSLVGCLMVIGVFSGGADSVFGGQALGFLFVFLSAFCWAVYSVAGKPVVEKLGGFPASAWAMTLGSLEILAIWSLGPFERVWPSTPTSWGAVAYIAVFPTAVAFLAWYEAMERIPLPLLNVMQYLTPVFTIILAWALLHERMSWSAVGGAVLVLAGVALTTERRKVEHAGDAQPVSSESV